MLKKKLNHQTKDTKNTKNSIKNRLLAYSNGNQMSLVNKKFVTKTLEQCIEISKLNKVIHITILFPKSIFPTMRIYPILWKRIVRNEVNKSHNWFIHFQIYRYEKRFFF